MNQVEAEQLRMEIAHIFESGANEIRIFEMVKSFTERRSQVNKLPIHSVSGSSYSDDFWKQEYDEAVKEIGKLQDQLKDAESVIRDMESELRSRY